MKRKSIKTIEEINAAFERRVNIEVQPLDDLVGFFDKRKDDDTSLIFQKPYNVSRGAGQLNSLTYKPRNAHLLDKIRREMAERDQQ